jgi:hypothetical protein
MSLQGYVLKMQCRRLNQSSQTTAFAALSVYMIFRVRRALDIQRWPQALALDELRFRQRAGSGGGTSQHTFYGCHSSALTGLPLSVLLCATLSRTWNARDHGFFICLVTFFEKKAFVSKNDRQ